MTSASLEPLEDFVSRTLEQPIHLLLSNRFYPAALVVTFSAIDTMAYLAMPATRLDVMRSDFTDWTEKYMIFEGSWQLPTAHDLYGARCGILHGQGTACRRTREGKCQPIRFVAEASVVDSGDQSDQKRHPTPGFLKLDVDEFVEAFLAGAKRFLFALTLDAQALKVACARLGAIGDSIPTA